MLLIGKEEWKEKIRMERKIYYIPSDLV